MDLPVSISDKSFIFSFLSIVSLCQNCIVTYISHIMRSNIFRYTVYFCVIMYLVMISCNIFVSTFSVMFCLKRTSLICLFHLTKRCVSISLSLFLRTFGRFRPSYLIIIGCKNCWANLKSLIKKYNMRIYVCI